MEKIVVGMLEHAIKSQKILMRILLARPIHVVLGLLGALEEAIRCFVVALMKAGILVHGDVETVGSSFWEALICV